MALHLRESMPRMPLAKAVYNWASLVQDVFCVQVMRSCPPLLLGQMGLAAAQGEPVESILPWELAAAV